MGELLKCVAAQRDPTVFPHESLKIKRMDSKQLKWQTIHFPLFKDKLNTFRNHS